MIHLVQTLKEKSKAKRPYMIGISGIDGSGKGYIAERLIDALRADGFRCDLIGIDGWLQAPGKRFSETDPARHFYENGFRFAEMKERLLVPLARDGQIDLVAKHSDPSNSDTLTDHHYHLENVHIVLVEGIFLFQDGFDFDYRIWIECSYETALSRALARNQEGLSEAQITADYAQIYFAAQALHLERDQPRARCDFIYLNDLAEKDSWP